MGCLPKETETPRHQARQGLTHRMNTTNGSFDQSAHDVRRATEDDRWYPHGLRLKGRLLKEG